MICGLAPLPDDPVAATVCTAPRNFFAFASGMSPSAMVVAKQPGLAMYRALEMADRLSSGMP